VALSISEGSHKRLHARAGIGVVGGKGSTAEKEYGGGAKSPDVGEMGFNSDQDIFSKDIGNL